MTWPETRSPGLPTPPSSRDDSPAVKDDSAELLRHYFNLDINLEQLYQQWSDVDPNFRKKAPTFTGVRILNQDAWEALIAFICSSNNNISRISQMVHKLCKNYGPFIGTVDDEAYHDFPPPEALIGKEVEAHLRELGFGYRAKYIAATARMVALDKPSDWLESLRNPESPGFDAPDLPREDHATYQEAQEGLLSLKGVGPKVADCVCLMGLGWGESVPVDTHVWQIAQRDYKFGKKAKTFNKAMYDAVGEHFRTLWGKYAGWAHSVLFTADLRQFSDRSTTAKEEAVQVKQEILEPELPNIRKKRKAVVAAEVKEEIKVEETVDGKLIKAEATTKRRRTRARP